MQYCIALLPLALHSQALPDILLFDHHRHRRRDRRAGQVGQPAGMTIYLPPPGEALDIMPPGRPIPGGCRPFGMVRPILGVIGRCPLGVSQEGSLARQVTTNGGERLDDGVHRG